MKAIKNTVVYLLIATCLAAAAELQTSLSEEFTRNFAKSANLSFTVKQTTTGKLLVNINSLMNTQPASTQKIVTTWVALDVLGPEKTWRTDLCNYQTWGMALSILWG